MVSKTYRETLLASEWYRSMWLCPNPEHPTATETVSAIDEHGHQVDAVVVAERPLTIYINRTEIITQMTVGLYPRLLAIGYLRNQRLLPPPSEIIQIDYDDELGVVVVRTHDRSNHRESEVETQLTHRTQTSGCAQGTMFGNLMEELEQVRLEIRPNTLTGEHIQRLLERIQLMPSLYLKAGAIHGCTLAAQDRPLLTVEDIGRHNAMDIIAGYCYEHQISVADKVLFTTGRLTSEMVIKTIQLGIPILMSRSGYTVPAIALARQCRLTLIGRARGKRLQILATPERVQLT